MKRSLTPLRVLPAALIGVVAVISFIAQAWWVRDPTSPAQWAAAAQYVQNEVKPGEVVRIHPSWKASPLVYLADIGEQIQPQDEPLSLDLQGTHAIWILTESKRANEALRQLPFPAKASTQKLFDDVAALHVEVPDFVQSDYVLSENLAEANVFRVDPNGETTRCEVWDTREKAWYCGKRNRYLYVGKTFQEIGDDPHQCIWAHPLGGPKKLRIEFEQVPFDKVLLMRAGMTLQSIRSRRPTPVQYTIFVNDQAVARRDIGLRDPSFAPHEIDTSKWAGTKGTVRLEVQSGKVFERYFCFDGATLSSAPSRWSSTPH